MYLYEYICVVLHSNLYSVQYILLADIHFLSRVQYGYIGEYVHVHNYMDIIVTYIREDAAAKK